MGMLSGMGTAFVTAISTFRNAYINPETLKSNSGYDIRVSVFRQNWQLYSNEAFEDRAIWAAYLEALGMYDYTRLIYNPFRRLVDFYVGAVWPGRLSSDGLPFPNGVDSAIPFSEDMDDGLKAACAQLFAWSNWQQGKNLAIRFMAICGLVFLELVDDTEAGKVRISVIWPGLLDFEFLELDDVGNVKQYAYEYSTTDPDTGDEYMFRKEVTQDEIRWFRDTQPFDLYDNGQTEIPNPYGFAPGALMKCIDLGGSAADNVLRGDRVKVDELNSWATHGLDLGHKRMDPPVIIFSEGSLSPVFQSKNRFQQEAFNTNEGGFDVRTDLQLYHANATNGRAQELCGQIDLEKVGGQTKLLLDEIEKDFPELTVFQKLREMTQVTGPAARRLLGDSVKYYDEICSNADQAMVKVCQMGIAIAGFRYGERLGGWLAGTQQQAKFSGIGLDSYKRDELNVEILQREFLPLTEEETLAIEAKQIGNANAAAGLVPLDERQRIAGYEDAAVRKKFRDELTKEEGLLEPNESEDSFR